MKNASIIIGITGLPGSGKSNLLRCLRLLGIPCLSADRVVQDILERNPQVLMTAFPEVFQEGHLNKKLLAQTVFESPQALWVLEDVLHPLVYQEIQDFIREHMSNPLVALEIPLLFETSDLSLFDEILEAHCDEQERHQRLLSRGWSIERINGSLHRYIKQEERHRLASQVIPTDQGKVKAWLYMKNALEHLCKP